MTNQEIMQEIKNLLEKRLNVCDFELELRKFNKQYKKSLFYKQTHISLRKLLKKYREYVMLTYTDLDVLFAILQEKIDQIDFTNFVDILDKAQDFFGSEFEKNESLVNELAEMIGQPSRGE